MLSWSAWIWLVSVRALLQMAWIWGYKSPKSTPHLHLHYICNNNVVYGKLLIQAQYCWYKTWIISCYWQGRMQHSLVPRPPPGLPHFLFFGFRHSRDRCSQAFPVFRALLLPCIILNENRRTKNGGGLGTRLTYPIMDAEIEWWISANSAPPRWSLFCLSAQCTEVSAASCK